ncbi:MAG TPA: N-acetyltransferase DgcN [Steroidobacteraceae bacterium]|nr:N-acetyltransferase DgcN [Steroidobacteraceae bacterium]
MIASPYLLFLGDAPDIETAKTAAGIRQWRGELCAGQLRLPGCRVDLGLPDLTPHEAQSRGIRTLIIGIANDGGFIAPHWVPSIASALEAGLDVASGLHEPLAGVPEIAAAAQRTGRRLIEVRQPAESFMPGTGRKRSGQRLLTVGTDCAVGKKYTALAIEKELRSRGVDADFRATGQTGIFISGRGIAVDSVVSDFVSGAAEWLSPAAAPQHWDVIEGQGSLFHPAYAGVTLGLIHGSQPDVMVLCHDFARTGIADYEGYAIPSYEACFEAYLAAARLTNSAARFAGVSLNTSSVDEAAAGRAVADVAARTGLPCCDPIRHGVAPIVDRILEAP